MCFLPGGAPARPAMGVSLGFVPSLAKEEEARGKCANRRCFFTVEHKNEPPRSNMVELQACSNPREAPCTRHSLLQRRVGRLSASLLATKRTAQKVHSVGTAVMSLLATWDVNILKFKSRQPQLRALNGKPGCISFWSGKLLM